MILRESRRQAGDAVLDDGSDGLVGGQRCVVKNGKGVAIGDTYMLRIAFCRSDFSASILQTAMSEGPFL